MEDKVKNFLMCLGAISIILLPAAFHYEHKYKQNIETIVNEYYKLEEKILEMVSANQDIIIDSEASESYDYYNYDDFQEAFKKCDDIIRDIES